MSSANSGKLEQRKQILLEEREQIMKQILALQKSLVENDEDPELFKSAYVQPKLMLRSEYHGLMWNRGFTIEGVKKVHAIFTMFDLDEDGQLSYEEFCGYLSALDRWKSFDQTAIQGPESFTAYMNDVYETSPSGYLTFGGFLAYMHSIQSHFPLVEDLLLLKMPLDSELISKHQQMARIFDAFDHLAGEGRLHVDDLPLLMNHCGLTLTEQQCDEVFQRQLAHHQAMAAIRQRYARRRFYTFEQISKIDANDLSGIYRDAMIALWCSGHRYADLSPTGWHLNALKVKYGSQMLLRQVLYRCRKLISGLQMGQLSKMLSSVAKNKEDLGSYEISLDIGEVDDEEEEMNFEFFCNTNAPAQEVIQAMDYAPRGVDGYCHIDFLIRSSADELKVPLTVNALEQFLGSHFERELAELPHVDEWTGMHACVAHLSTCLLGAHVWLTIGLLQLYVATVTSTTRL